MGRSRSRSPRRERRRSRSTSRERERGRRERSRSRERDRFKKKKKKIQSSMTVSCVERCENQPKHFQLSPLNGHILVFHQSLSCEQMTSQSLSWALWVTWTVLSELNLASYVLLNSYTIYSQILIARRKSYGEDSFCSKAITAIMDPMGHYQFTPFCVFLTMLFLI